MTDLPALPWDNISSVSLALIFTWLVVTGRLVPRAIVDRLLADRDARIAYNERQFDAQQAVKYELATQNTKLLSSAELSTKLLNAIAPPTSRETHVVQGEE
ncbi:hypothetical protein [Nocardia fluminea]|uniref:Uncharacterized protein n=1 Tax=Nocardia fluminea TaxID=134984 RepID=A0A2N3VH13_9NOCA|nr:hypothetical protein [Nocardia fluminea]PKV80922.1 hypothetical protein ATK86_5359 [Nocardia fluminea]